MMKLVFDADDPSTDGFAAQWTTWQQIRSVLTVPIAEQSNGGTKNIPTSHCWAMHAAPLSGLAALAVG